MAKVPGCYNLTGAHSLILIAASVVSYIKRVLRKPLKPRGQGAARREILSDAAPCYVLAPYSRKTSTT
jgi:hypothetical protein